ncbi:MAG: hypothetical protein RR816_07095 [Clostridia bacterium]
MSDACTLPKKQRTCEVWRYLFLMTLGVLLNTGFHALAEAFNLPMWLDFTGTALCALLLEPAAGLLVALANNFLLAIEFGSPRFILYYAVGASIALIIGLTMRKQGKLCLNRIPLTALLLVVICSALSTALTFWLAGGVTGSHWEQYFCQWFSAKGFPYWLALYFGVACVKVLGVAITTVLVAALCLVLPKCLKRSFLSESK